MSVEKSPLKVDIGRSNHCPLPWTHLATHPDGQVSLCCEVPMESREGVAGNGDKYCHLGENSFEEIANSRAFREIRKEMLSGKRPSACRNCYQREDRGTESRRVWELRAQPISVDELRSRTKEDGSIVPRYEDIELRLSNICNVKCVTCNPYSSLKILGDFQEINKHLFVQYVRDFKNLDRKKFEWAESDFFWDQMQTQIPSVRRININGGEPLLSKRHFHFLQELVDSGQSQNIELNYISNMTQPTQNHLKLWRQFKKIVMSASVDCVDQKNFYVRYPTVWSDVVENLDFLHNCPEIHLEIIQTISLFNFYYLDDFFTWANNRYPGIRIGYNFLHSPNYFSAHCIPPAIRKNALVRLKETLSDSHFSSINGLYRGSDWDQSGLATFFKVIERFDAIRDVRFEEYFPELHQEMEIYRSESSR